MEDGHTSKTCCATWWCGNHQEGFDCNNANQYIAVSYNACTKAMHRSQFPASWQCEAEKVEHKCLTPFDCYIPTSYPILNALVDNVDITIVTINTSLLLEMCAPGVHPWPPSIPWKHAVADTGATHLCDEGYTHVESLLGYTAPDNWSTQQDDCNVNTCMWCGNTRPPKYTGRPHCPWSHSGITGWNLHSLQSRMHSCVYRYSLLHHT